MKKTILILTFAILFALNQTEIFAKNYCNSGGSVTAGSGNESSEVNVKTATGYYNRAIAEFGYGNIPAAIENMNKAIELKPDYGDALSYRGYFYKLQNQNDKSISDYLAANKIKNNINGYFTAVPYALTGNKDEAFKWLDIAIAGPDNKPSLDAIINDKDLESLHSDPRWNTFIKKDWFSAYEKLINEGNNKITANDLDGALSVWNKAIETEPKNDIAYGQRAITYIRKGDAENAMKDLNEAIRLKPENSTYYGNRAYIYKELGKNKEALSDYDKAIQLDPQNMVYADRAIIKEKINMSDPSVADDLKTHLDAYYNDDFYSFYLGTNYFINNKMNESINYLSKAISIKPEGDYYLMRGKAYFANKEIDKAINDYGEAINIKNDDGEAYYFRGTAKGEKLDKDGACSDWRKAESLGYKDPNGYIRDICK
ncbi:MAG: hypothetical protein A2046_09935 [Bacteroidetes bacterium GWA2_30_7]|nr:MAG: hypothetical protein A2046_09935 [Bacteroidetes bacterium GWA2_30_7]